MAASGWNFGVGYLTILWFHEFWVGGRNEPDSIFSNWNALSLFSLLVQTGLAGFAVYKTNNHADGEFPIALTANAMAIMLGVWFNRVIAKWNKRQEEIDYYFEHHYEAEIKDPAGEEAADGEAFF